MPTYEFRCPDGHVFDKFYRSISAAQMEVPCTTCGKPAARQISGGAGLQFKGSGFYLTDYGKNAHRGGAAPAKGDASGNGKPGGDAPASSGASGGSEGGAASSASSSGGEKPAGGSSSGSGTSGGSSSGSSSSGGTSGGTSSGGAA